MKKCIILLILLVSLVSLASCGDKDSYEKDYESNNQNIHPDVPKTNEEDTYFDQYDWNPLQ